MHSNLLAHLNVSGFTAAVLCGLAQAASPEDQAEEILTAAGFTGVLIVHAHCGDGQLTAALGAESNRLVQGLETDEALVDTARATIKAKGIYGRVSVDHWDGELLPYTDNLITLIVSSQPLGVPVEEIRRVLSPGGALLVKSDSGWEKFPKPRPDRIDEWTHYFYDAKGNPVSKDREIDSLRHLQWTGSPRWARMHDHMSSFSACVSAGNRIFYIFDEGSPLSIFLPSKWQLIARDAFNGTILWKRDIPKWHTRFYGLKSGPATLPRRVVAIGDQVWATLAIDSPVSLLEAATGATIKTFSGTEGTEEIIVDGDTVLVVVNPSPTDYPLKPRRSYDYRWPVGPRKVMALHKDTGKVLWQTDEKWVAPLTLQSDGERAYFHDGKELKALTLSTGKPAWDPIPLPVWGEMYTMFGPTVTIYEDILLFAGGESFVQHKGGEDTMTAISTRTGKVLWTAAHPPSGYQSPEDLFVINDVVWSGNLTSGGNNPGKFTGRDVRTGKVVSEFEADIDTHWFHHRCHQARATERYILTSRTGIEFVDPVKKHWDIHHWVRGACLYGIMPANGMIYAPQHPCSCYLVAKMYGLTALGPVTPGKSVPRRAGAIGRLEKGPVYKGLATLQSVRSDADWPVYRHDMQRSGRADMKLSPNLSSGWTATLGGRLSAPIVAGGMVFVSKPDEHTVVALNQETGGKAWEFTGGGRIDSAPTYHDGLLVFGCMDGYVYCLRAEDGVLGWRYRAAPMDRRLSYFEQIESVWPVPGSVLVKDGKVHCVAGRSLYLDGGLSFLRLDLRTGRRVSERIIGDRDPDSGENLQVKLEGLNMPTALNDILSSDGEYFYMRLQQFDREGNRTEVVTPDRNRVSDQSGAGQHLFSPTGFLDDSWWHRTYWVFGKSWLSGAGGYMKAGQNAPSGRILCFDDDMVYGYARKSEYYKWTDVLEYKLFCSSKNPTIQELWQRKRNAAKGKGKAKAPKRQKPPQLRSKIERTWERDVPLFVRAMVMADDTLFIAGPPDVLDEEVAHTKLDSRETQKQMQLQDEILAGKQGAILRAVRSNDGSTITEHKLDSLPLFDGMAAAHGCLFISTEDGKILCLKGR